MALKKNQLRFLANKLITARSKKIPIPALSNEYSFSMKDAYRIQQLITEHKIRKGQKIIGWKLGYTSLAMREQMNVSEPNFGPLLNGMILFSGSSVSKELVQPKVEPEIAVKFGKSLSGSVIFDEIVDAVESAYGALEIVDSVYDSYNFKIQDNTADGSSAAQFVLGPTIEKYSLEKTEVVFLKNGNIVDTCKGSAASGHPLNGIFWLIKSLGEHGSRIEAGQIVITGGLTSAVDIRKGDHIRAILEGSKEVEVYGYE